MKIALFGATGRVGGHVLKKALDQEHTVTVLVRSAEKLTDHKELTVIQGDVRSERDVVNAISGMDVVLSALGTSDDILTESTPHIINAMKKMNSKRILTIGTAGILESRVELGKLRYQEKNTFRRSTYDVEEHHKAYNLLKKSGLDWTIICPTYLPDGNSQGDYRIERDYLPEGGKQITVGDTADFALDELLASDYVGSRVGISY